MSDANDKVSKDTTGLVPEFLSPNKGKVNGPNNYLAWAGAMHTTMGARYGPMTRVFADQVPYVVPDLGHVTATYQYRTYRTPYIIQFT